MINDRIPYTYVITNLITGKRYYGARYAKGCSPVDLWSTYFTSSRLIHNLISQHGIHQWKVEIRKVFESVTECVSWEHRVLRRLGIPCNPFWYNQAVTGEKFCLQSPITDQHRHKLSLHHKKRWNNPAYRTKMKQIMETRWSTDHSRIKHSQQIKDKWLNAEWKARILEQRRIQNQDPIMRERKRQASLRNWQSEDYRKKHKESMDKVRQDPKWLEANRQRLKERWADPVQRQRIMDSRGPASPELCALRSKSLSQSNRSTWQDPEIRAKRIAGMKAARKRRKEAKNQPPSHEQ